MSGLDGLGWPNPEDEPDTGDAPVCEAVTYMDRIGYGGFFEEAEKRAALGEVQTYCQTCGLCRWPEEQRTCPHFVLSEELETFYAERPGQ